MQVKLKAGLYKHIVDISNSGDTKLALRFGFNRALINEIKSFEGARWNPEAKCWTINNSQRNLFQLDYLAGNNPYARYDSEYIDYIPKRSSLYKHQVEAVKFILTRKRCILAAEMGCVSGSMVIGGMSVREWCGSKMRPNTLSYDKDGNIVESEISRIQHLGIQDTVSIRHAYGISTVGKDHHLLIIREGKPCIVTAETLSRSDLLVSGKTAGGTTTSNPSLPSSKLTGLASGTETVQSISRMVDTEASSLLKNMVLLLSSQEISTIAMRSLMARLSYLVLSGSECPSKDLGPCLSYLITSLDTSYEEYLTQMDLYQQGRVQPEIDTLLQRYAMLQEICSGILRTTLEPKYIQDTTPTKYLSVVGIVSSILEITSMAVRHAILNTSSTDSGKPGTTILAQESKHVIPATFRHLEAIEVLDLTYGRECIYDITVPIYGNYFEDNGINHQNCGKTLIAIEAIEHVQPSKIWYVGPVAGVRAVKREALKWDCNLPISYYTYEGFTNLMGKWDGGSAPDFVIFDESSKIKNPGAKRSIAAQHLSDAVRKENDGYVVLMTGTPAPRSPVDWYHQTEVACPGFLKEGTIQKFKARLCIIEQRQSITGAMYPHILGWRDNEHKCNICGEDKDNENHTSVMAVVNPDKYHSYQPCTNEVNLLYDRLKGLVLVQFKKDCLDLPEKTYEIIKVSPTVELLRAYKMIVKTSTRAVTALTMCRELSDGFQYREVATGDTESCPACTEGQIIDHVNGGTMDCPHCKGKGVVDVMVREAAEVGSPKDDVFRDMLDEHEDIGRFIVWGGFSGTIDRLVGIASHAGWTVLRVDGRGYHATEGDAEELLSAMDASHPRYGDLMTQHPKICFVGHPRAGGMALTLTASPTELFYSNDFDGEARMQAEDRFHRAGMDLNRGARIVDLILLPTDKLVLDNLKMKKNLQTMSMSELEALQ